MWVVVHFFNEDTVEAVPETWYRKKDKTCAWPIVSKKSKKYIEKKDYPDENNYQWLPARMLGRKYGSLEEARSKTNFAQFYSDLSANEDSNAQRLLKSKSKMESPPSLRLKKIKKTVENTVFDDESDIEDGHDSEKDPDYHQPISVNVQSVSQTMTNRNNKYVMNSPIGKILIEETSPSIMSSMPPKQPFIEHITLPSPVSQRSNTTPLSHPIKRVLFPTVDSQGSNNRSSKYNTEYDCGMTDTAFKNFVISSLTKVKHEISAIHSTVNSNYIVLEGFINNFGQSRATEIAMQYESECSLDDFFPITNEEELQLLNNKIKSDKQFRLNMVSKLSLLVGTKDVGDSVRRLMGRMFIDDVLTEYSLLGKKKKKNFSELPVYQLLIDALRIHQKYKDKINKDFNDPLANWLNHSKFRLLNKAVEKNNKQ